MTLAMTGEQLRGEIVGVDRLGRPRRMVPIPARFWPKVDKDGAGGCWLWTANKDTHGYGQFRIGSRVDGSSKYHRAHRIAYELLVGPIPEGLVIDHLCRTKACVNPAHMEPVTPKENTRRGLGPRMNRERLRAMTHCKRGHEYNEQNTYYRASGKRTCRICARLCRAALR